MRGALEPEQVFQSIPGIGPKLAQRLHEALDVDSLEALEIAAHNGRLDQVEGIGRRQSVWRWPVCSEAWLPVLHIQRGQWYFTALYSNTARAHELERTQDWVVLYFYDDHHYESQHTVVTETRGPLAGQRVVRGREAACREYYRQARESA